MCVLLLIGCAAVRWVADLMPSTQCMGQMQSGLLCCMRVQLHACNSVLHQPAKDRITCM